MPVNDPKINDYFAEIDRIRKKHAKDIDKLKAQFLRTAPNFQLADGLGTAVDYQIAIDPDDSSFDWHINGAWFRINGVGPWIYYGTPGVDGVDAELAANPHPYATGDTPGPSPFVNSWTNSFINGVSPFRARITPMGIQTQGGVTGGADMTVLTTLVGVPAPDYNVPDSNSADDLGSVFTFMIDTSLNVTVGVTGI